MYQKNIHQDDYTTNHGPTNRINVGALWRVSNNERIRAGVEVGYTWYADNTYNNNGQKLNYSGKNFDLLGRVGYQFANRWWLSGRLGGAYVIQETYGNTSFNQRNTKLLPKAGVLVSYDLSDHFDVHAGFSYVFGSKADEFGNPHQTKDGLNRVAPVFNWSLGINYHL